MIDQFLATRHAVIYWSNQRQAIEDKIFEEARRRARTDIQLPDPGKLLQQQDMPLLVQFFRLQLNMLFHTGDIHLGTRLLRVITLCKWSDRLRLARARSDTAMRAAIGFLTQQELTLLLLDIDPLQLNRLWLLGSSQGLHQRSWQRQISGARAMAHVISSQSTRPEATLLLPTGDEDISLGIDLYWLEGDLNLCLSVKSQSSLDGTQLILAHGDFGKHKGPKVKDQWNIQTGALRLQERLRGLGFPRTFEPVLIRIGYPNGHPPLLPARNCLQGSDALLTAIHASKRKHSRRRAL